jgi:hypothetical protein
LLPAGKNGPPSVHDRHVSQGDPKDDLERLRPYLSDFAEAALLEGEDCALLCAVALRETHAGWAPGYKVPAGNPRHLGYGDAGHGFGLFQVDDRGPYAYLPREAPQATPYLQARWACWVLKDAREELREFKDLPVLEVAAICAYNAGSPAVKRQLRQGKHPDHATAHGDYGSDVLRRRDELRRKHPDVFPPFVRIREVA